MIHINNMMSPSRLAQRSWGMVAVAGVKLVGEVGKGIKANAEKRKAKEENEKAKIEMDKAMDKYRNMDTSNPYLNMENTMEDLTVNTQAAEMASEQNQIGMADTLGKMNQAAGGSGIAALAQTLANQGALQAQKIGAVIGQEELNIQKLINYYPSRKVYAL